MKYAICNETFQDWDWAETCAAAAEHRYDGIEIAPFTLAEDVRALSSHARKELYDTAKRSGLKVVGLHWLLLSPKGMSLTTLDESVRTQTSEYLEALVDFCADMGGEVMTLGSPGQRRIPPGDKIQNVESRFLDALSPALKRAEMHKITLCLEPLPAPEADFILTLDQAIALVDRLDNPYVKTTFDVKSASSESSPLNGLIQEFAPMIAHFHANDENRRGPGFGKTDFVPIMSALKDIEYKGFVSVEVFDYTPDPVTIARESLAYLKRCEKGDANDESTSRSGIS